MHTRSGNDYSSSHLPPGKYYKLFNFSECHHGMQYKDGLNEDILLFDCSRECSPGGLYFYHESQLKYFGKYTPFDPYWIREVTIPEDAQVHAEQHKYKASKLFLKEQTLFSDFLAQRPELCLASTTQHGAVLQYVPYEMQTENVCLAAVTQDGYALPIVPCKMMTPAVCLAAVNQKGSALQWVPLEMRTEKMCLVAVTRTTYALQFVPPSMKKVCEDTVNKLFHGTTLVR